MSRKGVPMRSSFSIQKTFNHRLLRFTQILKLTQLITSSSQDQLSLVNNQWSLGRVEVLVADYPYSDISCQSFVISNS